MFHSQILRVFLLQIWLIFRTKGEIKLEFFDDSESISICALKVGERHFGDFANVNIFSLNSSTDYDLFSKYDSSPKFAKKTKNLHTFTVDFYEGFKKYSVVAAQNLKDIIKFNEPFRKLMLWNARSRYIFIIRENSFKDLDRALTILWYYYIINAVVLMPSNEDSNNIQIYSWFPYKDGLCGKDFDAELVDTCNFGKFEKMVDLFPEKVPKILNGCPVRAKVIIAPPYVMPPDDGVVRDGEVLNITDGTEINLMRTIAKLMNFTFLPMSSTIPNDWGLATEDGNTSGTIKVLCEKGAELGFGSYGPSAERRMYCDNSVSHTYESISWCVPKAQLAPRWRNILDSFKYSTWISMIGAYIAVSCITWAFCYTLPKDTSSFVEMQNSFKNLFSIFISVGASDTPSKTSGRIMFFVWVVFGIHFVAAYQAKLIGGLLHPPLEKQIDTLDEIFHSDLEWASLPTLKRFYNNTDDWRVAKIINEWKTEQSAVIGLTRIATKHDFAFGVLETNARYEILRFVDKNSEPLVFCLPSYLIYPSEIYMTKGFPLRDRINKLIYAIKSTGLMELWANDASYKLKLKNRKTIKDDDDTQKLTLGQLQGAFMVLGLGLVCSTAAFIGEFIYLFIKTRALRKKFFVERRNKSKLQEDIKSINITKNEFLLPTET